MTISNVTNAPSSTVATQTSQARVQYAATYSDAARTLVQPFFAPCQMVYLGAKLLPAGTPYALEWYPKASPVRGTDTPYRAVDPWPVSGGVGTDQLVAPVDALGTWTVLVVQKGAPDVVLGGEPVHPRERGVHAQETELAVEHRHAHGPRPERRLERAGAGRLRRVGRA